MKLATIALPWPLDLLARSDPPDTSLRRGLISLLPMGLIAAVIGTCTLEVLFVHASSRSLGTLAQAIWWMAVACGMLAWVIALGALLRGRALPPRISGALRGLARWRWIPWLMLEGAVVFIAWSTVQATDCRTSIEGARIVYLADPSCGPLWVHRMAAAPLVSAARRDRGGTVAVVPFSLSALGEALAEAEVVFVASHGQRGVLLSGERRISSFEVAHVTKGKALRCVYLCGCDAGMVREEWENALRPATVIAYARRTSMYEHLAWLWFSAPRLA
jgi:hypothetical protein